MTELIPIHQTTIKNETTQAVDARALHEFMAIGRDFPTWITGRIDYVGYEEGRDYIKGFSPVLAKTPNGGRPRIEYLLTLDMAKELCMMERNEMGRLARKYFIRCEKKAKQAGADAAILRDTLLRANPVWGKIAEYRAKGLSHKDIGILCGMSRHFVGLAIDQMKACRIIIEDKALPAVSTRTVIKQMIQPLPKTACGTRMSRAGARELLAAKPLWVKLIKYRSMDLNFNEIGTLCRVSRTTVRDNLRRMADCGLSELAAGMAMVTDGREVRYAIQ